MALLLGSSTVDAQTADDLFASQTLQRLDLWVNSADWEKLKVNFQVNTYYPADVVWSGQTVRNVGIRSRGRGSRSSNKPGLRVDFDHYATGQKFLDLKSFVLDNLTQDPSGIHETVATGFYARLGIRCHARSIRACMSTTSMPASMRSSRQWTRICWRACSGLSTATCRTTVTSTSSSTRMIGGSRTSVAALNRTSYGLSPRPTRPRATRTCTGRSNP